MNLWYDRTCNCVEIHQLSKKDCFVVVLSNIISFVSEKGLSKGSLSKVILTNIND